MSTANEYIHEILKVDIQQYLMLLLMKFILAMSYGFYLHLLG